MRTNGSSTGCARTPGVIITRSQQLIVSTSARLEGRCDGGFAATLAALVA